MVSRGEPPDLRERAVAHVVEDQGSALSRRELLQCDDHRVADVVAEDCGAFGIRGVEDR